MMKELDSAGPMSKHTNVALEIIRNFPVVVFSTKGEHSQVKSLFLRMVLGDPRDSEPVKDITVEY